MPSLGCQQFIFSQKKIHGIGASLHNTDIILEQKLGNVLRDGSKGKIKPAYLPSFPCLILGFLNRIKDEYIYLPNLPTALANHLVS